MPTGASGVVRFDPPGLVQRFVLEQPWPLVAVLVVAGAAALALLNQRGRAGLGLVCGCVALALAGAVYAVSAAVETVGEALQARTRVLVADGLSGDVAGFGRLLEEQAGLDILGGTRRDGRDAIVQLAADVRQRYPLHAWSMGDVRALVDSDTVGQCQFRLTAEPEATRLPSGSWWVVTWRKGADGEWLVWSISAQQIDGVGAGSRIGL